MVGGDDVGEGKVMVLVSWQVHYMADPPNSFYGCDIIGFVP